MADDIRDPSETAGKLIAASKVNSTTVYDTAGEKSAASTT